MPMRWASLFIRNTNAVSSPATASASATAASLPDCTIKPCSKSLTDTGVAGSMNILELLASTFQALGETLTIWSMVSFLSRRAPKVT